jgi:hypothetical protein
MTKGSIGRKADGRAVTIERVAHSPDSESASRRRRPRVLVSVVIVLAVATAVAWVTGGLRAKPSAIAMVGPGKVVDQGLFKVRILDARAGVLKVHSFDTPANLLVVRMQVTDVGDQSYGISSFLNGLVAESKPGTYVQADLMQSEGDVHGSLTSTIHPRLPVTLQVRWKLPKDTTPRSVAIVLRQWSYGQGFTDETFYWNVTKDSPIAAKVTVPVRAGATS